MEVRTQEIIRYIDLRFKEQDLKDLISEIDTINSVLSGHRYVNERENIEKIQKLLEFKNVLSSAVNQLKH